MQLCVPLRRRNCSRRLTNDSYIREVVRKGEIEEAMRYYGTKLHHEHHAPKHYTSAYMQAFSQRAHTPQKSGDIISLSALMEGNGVLGTSVATGVVRRSVKLMEIQPELKGLKTCMSQFMHGQDAPLNCDEIRVSNGAVLCAVLPWDDGGTSTLQTVRATSNFHGKPWYDL